VRGRARAARLLGLGRAVDGRFAIGGVTVAAWSRALVDRFAVGWRRSPVAIRSRSIDGSFRQGRGRVGRVVTGGLPQGRSAAGCGF